MSKNYYLVYLIGFFLILALPLLAIPPLFFPPEWGKAIAFRIIFSSILFLLFWQTTSNHNLFQQLSERYKSQKKAVWMLFTGVLTVFLSTIFSSDILFSLWASPHRSGGSVVFTFFILLSITLFLILKSEDWKKLWNFSFIIGDLVVAFALLQYFNVFPSFLISYGRPVSTLSNSILLAIYLLLLAFPASSFAIVEKSKKRFFYVASLLLFIFGILITGSRAAYIGLLIGAFYFFFFYPVKKESEKKLPILKIAAVIILIFAAFTVYYLNSQFYIPKFLEKNKFFISIQSRLSIGIALAEPRFSAWQVSVQAIKEKPILGWGPENLSIGFDKYYDPSLPYLTKEWGGWWDRAHNIFLDIPIQYGIPFLLIYLSFFGYLFLKLHKTKHETEQETTRIKTHGIQTVFIAYFSALFFGFDSVSTHLMLFFIIGYSLYLTHSDNIGEKSLPAGRQALSSAATNKRILEHRKIIISALLIILIIFLWKYNLKPLIVNAEINRTKNLTCDKKLPALEKLLNQKNFLDAFLRLTYAEDIKTCAENNPSKTIEYIKNGIDALKYASNIRPLYTRTWILLGSFKTILFVNEADPQIKKNLYEEINYDFNKALTLGPRHQEILSEWAKFYFAAEDYAKMKSLSEECVALNSDTNTCYWYLGLSEILLGDEKNGQEHLKTAREKGFPYTQSTYSQLAIAYIQTKNYEKLIPVYESLISLDPQNMQYYAALATVYKKIGDYKNARQTALKIIEIVPETKSEVDAFLRMLR